VRGGDQRPDQLDHVSGQPGGLAQAGMDEPGRDLGANTVGNFCFEVTLGYRRVERGR